jgi:hypothetical protein
MKLLFHISIVISLLLAILSLVFFEKQIMKVMCEGFADYTTAYVGLFLFVFVVTHKSFGAIVRRIKK